MKLFLFILFSLICVPILCCLGGFCGLILGALFCSKATDYPTLAIIIGLILGAISGIFYPWFIIYKRY